MTRQTDGTTTRATPDDRLLAPMAAAAREVAALLLRGPRPAPAATLAELAVQYGELEAPAVALMRERLDALRPGIPWADEGDHLAALPEDGEVWVVDVIDGAVQFMQGLPQFCVSLALVRDGEPVAAALHAPWAGAAGETYTAAAGRGAVRDGGPVAPSAKAELAAAVVATSQPSFVARQPEAAARAGRALGAVLPAVAAVRNLGPTSWQIADVGAGRLDGFWEFGRDDTNMVPGALIAREAGVLVTDAAGRPWRPGADGFVAAPPGPLHSGLLELLAAA